MFSPYKSKAFLARALREGQEDALAFADLVAFEKCVHTTLANGQRLLMFLFIFSALRADRRLRAEDKLRRWKVGLASPHWRLEC